MAEYNNYIARNLKPVYNIPCDLTKSVSILLRGALLCNHNLQ